MFSRGENRRATGGGDASGPSSSRVDPSNYTPTRSVGKSRHSMTPLGLNSSTPKNTPPSGLQGQERWSTSAMTTTTSSHRNRMTIPMYEKVLRPGTGTGSSGGDISGRENNDMSFFSNTSISSISTPENQPPNKQVASNRKDLSNYPPCQTFKLDHPGTRIYSVGNDITGETVIATTSNKRVVIYSIKLKDNVQEPEIQETSKFEDKFDIIKIHELHLNIYEMSCFSLSSLISVTLPPLKLLYAMAPRMTTTVYFYNQLDQETIPPSMKIDDVFQGKFVLQKINNPYPVTKMALDGEKEYLACVLSNDTVVAWDLSSSTKFVTFTLGSNGVHVEWHKSEPYKLMVVESSGWVKFYNVYKQSCFMSINAGRAPLYSADWANSNSLLTTIGWSGGFTVVNCSQLNSNLYKTFEIPQVNISKVKFNPVDDKVIATLGRTPGIIRLWRQNFMSHIWSHKNKVEDIAWVYGQPYLIALGYRSLQIYEASVV